MKKIKLVKPVVLTVFATENLQDDQLAVVRMLKTNKLYVVKEEDGLRFTERLDGALYGPEAIIAYLEWLGEKLQGCIREIDAGLMLSLVGNVDEATDLLYFIRRIEMRNSRVKRLMELKAPAVIMQNEVRLLGEAVEALWFNWDDEKRDDGTVRKCLMTI